MTNRDRDSLARLLLVVAERLRVAPEHAEQKAKDASGLGDGRSAYEAGVLGEICRTESGAIARYVAAYLTPKPAKPRGPRTRR